MGMPENCVGDLSRGWEKNERILKFWKVSIRIALNQFTLNLQKPVYVTFRNSSDNVPKKIVIERQNIEKLFGNNLRHEYEVGQTLSREFQKWN